MRFATGLCTLGLLLGVVSLLTMWGSLTPHAKMEACYELSGASYVECLQQNDQRSGENSERIHADYRRGVWLFKVSLGLIVLGGLLAIRERR